MARAARHMQTMMQHQQAGLEAMRRQLRLLSHENVLERGFALVLDESGKALREAAQAKTGSVLDIRLAREQHIAARVEGEAHVQVLTPSLTQNVLQTKKSKTQTVWRWRSGSVIIS